MPPSDLPKKPTFELPIIKEKLAFLDECINELALQLQKRQDQRLEFLKELEERLLEIQNLILELDQLGDVRNNKMSRRRIHLEHEYHAIEKEKRQREHDYWQDITDLQKELRSLRREYRAVRAGASCFEPKK